MILRARFVATMDGPVLEDGAVAVDGEFISDVGSFSDLRRIHSGDVVDLGEKVLLPGLINAHCHLDYTCLRGRIPRQKSFTAWIKAINAAKAGLRPQAYVDSINEGFAEARRFGTTCVVNLTAFPELIHLVRPGLRTYWAAELIDLRAPESARKLVDGAVEILSEMHFRALAPHAPYTSSPGLYHFCQERSLMLTTHLAESHEEMRMFRDGEGELHDFIGSINPAFESPRQTPLGYFLSQLDRDRSWLIAHLNELTEADHTLLAQKKPKFTIAHCPRSHAFFGHRSFQFERLKGQFPVCLGTDSLASNSDLNLFAEMRCFQKAFPNTSAEEIVGMVTRTPGLAQVGRLRPKRFADIIAVPTTGSGKTLFEEIIASEAEPWVMIGGKTGII